MPTPSRPPQTLFAGIAVDAGVLAPVNWVATPDFPELPRYDRELVLARWAQLNPSQAASPPATHALAEAWAHYHNGHFARAVTAAMTLGEAGVTLVNQATAIYADYVEPREATRRALFRQVAERAHARRLIAPHDGQALYWYAYALGRHAQAVNVARALAQGLGGQIKTTLERLIELQPLHAEAYFALGAFHSEVIDKVGALVARMTYGVRSDLALFERALALQPDSPSGLMEYGRALMALHGPSKLAEATRAYERAATHKARDARERLAVELARAGLSD